MLERSPGFSPRTYPYQICCPACDRLIVAGNSDWVVLVGPRPLELVGTPEGDVHVVCPGCGTLVPLNHELATVN